MGANVGAPAATAVTLQPRNPQTWQTSQFTYRCHQSVCLGRWISCFFARDYASDLHGPQQVLSATRQTCRPRRWELTIASRLQVEPVHGCNYVVSRGLSTVLIPPQGSSGMRFWPSFPFRGPSALPFHELAIASSDRELSCNERTSLDSLNEAV